MIDIRTGSLLDFVPDSIANDPEIIALSKAIDPELRAVSASIIEAIILPRIRHQPETVLDAFARQFTIRGVRLADKEYWQIADLASKRAFMANIFGLFRRRGTVWAVKKVFDLINVIPELVEWFTEAETPATFRVILNMGGDTTEAEILAAVAVLPSMVDDWAPLHAVMRTNETAVLAQGSGLAVVAVVPTYGHDMEMGFGADMTPRTVAGEGGTSFISAVASYGHVLEIGEYNV